MTTATAFVPFTACYSAPDSAPVDVKPHIDSIDPALGPADKSVSVSIVGSGFRASPSVNVHVRHHDDHSDFLLRNLLRENLIGYSAPAAIASA